MAARTKQEEDRHQPKRQGEKSGVAPGESAIRPPPIPSVVAEAPKALALGGGFNTSTGYDFVYLCKTSKANGSARHIRNFVILLQNMYFQPMVFHSDNEIRSKSLLGWLEK